MILNKNTAHTLMVFSILLVRMSWMTICRIDSRIICQTDQLHKQNYNTENDTDMYTKKKFTIKFYNTTIWMPDLTWTSSASDKITLVTHKITTMGGLWFDTPVTCPLTGQYKPGVTDSQVFFWYCGYTGDIVWHEEKGHNIPNYVTCWVNLYFVMQFLSTLFRKS